MEATFRRPITAIAIASILVGSVAASVAGGALAAVHSDAPPDHAESAGTNDESAGRLYMPLVQRSNTGLPPAPTANATATDQSPVSTPTPSATPDGPGPSPTGTYTSSPEHTPPPAATTPTSTGTASAAPEPSPTTAVLPSPTATPEPTASTEPTQTPEATGSPSPSATPSPSPTAARSPLNIYRVGLGTGCTHSSIQDAIAAAESSPGFDEIRVSRSWDYRQQALSINTGQELDIRGGFITCLADDDFTATLIDGAGGSAAPVLDVRIQRGGVVRLSRLRVEGGDVAGSGHGGGIHFRGEGRLELHDTRVSGNTAGYGGGIYAQGLGPDAALVIGAQVLIANNVARYSGGGVYIDDIALTMIEPGSSIALNRADGGGDRGFGGGLMIRSESHAASATIGSTGIGTLGAIDGNRARYGGGVAIVAEDYQASLDVLSIDAEARTSIRANFASVVGGGIYMRPYSPGPFPAFRVGPVVSASFWNADLVLNQAPDGAAAYLEESGALLSPNGSALYFNASHSSRERPARALPCGEGSHCGLIAENSTLDAAGNRTDGAIFHIKSEAHLLANTVFQPDDDFHHGGIVIRSNAAGRLFRATDNDDGSTFKLRNAVIHDNTLSLHLLQAGGGGSRVHIVDSTIARNAVGAGFLMLVQGQFTLARSILWQPGNIALSQSGGSRSVEWSIANEVASLGGAPGAVSADPRFSDPAGGDFGLRSASPAIDYAPALGSDDRDTIGLPRNIRLPEAPRPAGRVRDIGAFERQDIRPIVVNGDFTVNLNVWSPSGPDSARWDADQNAPGSTGGSALVSVTGAADARVTGLSQCVFLPGPGTYSLEAWGRSGGTRREQDEVILKWEVRTDGQGLCDAGPPDVAGDLPLAVSPGWTRPNAPAAISVREGDWTVNSSLKISLDVVDVGIFRPRNATGWFDGIRLDLIRPPEDPGREPLAFKALRSLSASWWP